MPEYFSLELMFTNERVKPDFVKEIYQYFTDAGFNFSGGYRWIGYNETKVKTTIREDFKQQLCVLCDLRASARNSSIFHASARCFLEVMSWQQ